ncbi:MAG TPA: HAMP domain-containing sensor histidine kinase [Mycobacteriales bacterium]|nr:HAMP domain-containing sensor histidine kinase [Mycobacteriales bacterium]
MRREAPGGLVRRSMRRETPGGPVSRPTWWWWLAAAPAVVAAAVAPVLPGGTRVYATTSARWAVAGCGLLVSLLVAGTLGLRAYVGRVRARAAAEAAGWAATDRRRLLLRLDHELKNPLTAIHIGLANLRAATAGAASGDGALGSVQAQVVRLGRLVADLRKLAELETQPIERLPVDVGDLLREVHAAVRELPDAADRDLTLTLPQAPWPLPPVSGDRDLLFLAVHNLASNAVKFSQPGDTVELRAAEERDHLVVEVADTGAGIPADELSEVWTELARGRAARGVPGTGLGLALVRTVVARHGGQATLRSREQLGTVVTLRLPLAR